MLLNAFDIPTTLQYYRFFEANLNLHYLGNQLFDFPVFLHCFPKVHSANLTIIAFDVCDNNYYLLQASPIIHLGPHQQNSTVFEESLLNVETAIYVASNKDEMVSFLAKR
jgi:hypothetical protein